MKESKATPNESISTRIDSLIKALDMSKNKFAHTIGSSSALISQITTTKETFRVDVLQKIISTFPSVNANWLLTGIGSMFLEDSNLQAPLEAPLQQKANKKRVLSEGSINATYSEAEKLFRVARKVYENNPALNEAWEIIKAFEDKLEEVEAILQERNRKIIGDFYKKIGEYVAKNTSTNQEVIQSIAAILKPTLKQAEPLKECIAALDKALQVLAASAPKERYGQFDGEADEELTIQQ